jgi:hypothetical protein
MRFCIYAGVHFSESIGMKLVVIHLYMHDYASYA